MGIMLSGTTLLHGGELSGKVVDGLGRPLEGALIQFFCEDRYTNERMELPPFITDEKGFFLKTVDDKCVCDTIMVSKDGFSLSGRDKSSKVFVLKKNIIDVESYITKLLQLEGEEFTQGVRELLGSSLPGIRLHEALFPYQEHFVSTLRMLLHEPVFQQTAFRILCYFSYPEDIQQLLFMVNQEQRCDEFLAGTLLSPSQKEEGLYLQQCLAGDTPILMHENTILALTIRGEKNTLELLTRHPEKTHRFIRRAIRWLDLHPQGLQSFSDLEKSAEAASEILLFRENDRGKLTISKKNITTNHQNTKAIVPCIIYSGPQSGKGYDFVFHRIGGLWILKGIWNTWVS